MQAWGTHTFEDFRPSNLYPTRSGLLGLLGACLGVERGDLAGQRQLAASVNFAVRVDRRVIRPGVDGTVAKPVIKLADFHTVMNARKVDGSAGEFPVVSSREYLFDAAFTVAIGSQPDATVGLDRVADALRRPLYTPTLGRRSCPLACPLLEGQLVEAAGARDALALVPPTGGLVYSETDVSEQPVPIRDVPVHGRTRRFATRLVYLHKEPSCF